MQRLKKESMNVLLGFMILNVFVTVASVLADPSGSGFLVTVYPVYIGVLWTGCVALILFFEKKKDK